MSSSHLLYNAAGVIGSLITASSLLPQIYHVVKRRSAADISYAYQAVFIAGICMFLVYYGYYELWEVFVPTTLSVLIMLSLVGLKAYYEELSPRRSAESAGGGGGEDTGSGSVPRSKRERGAQAEMIGGAKDTNSTSESQPLMSSW